MSKKILLLVGDFVEDYEAMVPQQMLVMLGQKVDTVCPGKKPGETVATSVHDFEGFQTYTEKRGHNFTINYDFAKVDAKDQEGIIIPGGRSPEYLSIDKKVTDMVKDFNNKKKVIGAICHGQLVLVGAELLKGRKVTGYPAIEGSIIACGATFISVNKTYDNVVVDGNLVTAPTWLAHPEFIRKFVELIGAKITI